MDGYRPQMGVFFAQRPFDLFGLDVRLAQGDVRVKKGVHNQVEFFVIADRAIGML